MSDETRPKMTPEELTDAILSGNPPTVDVELVSSRPTAAELRYYADRESAIGDTPEIVAALRAGADAMDRADKLAAELAAEESAHEVTIRQRDFAERWADKLAAGVGDIELIGEHSNLNNPWETAYNIMRSHAEYERLEADNVALTAELARLRAELGTERAASHALFVKLSYALGIKPDKQSWPVLCASFGPCEPAAEAADRVIAELARLRAENAARSGTRWYPI